MEYLHAKGIPHGLLTSSSITLHHRVCISLAPPHTRHAHQYFQPHHLTYLPPECVRQLHVVQSSSSSFRHHVSLATTTTHGTAAATAIVQSGESLTPLSSLGSTSCLTRSRAPSSPSLVAMATGGGGGGGRVCVKRVGSESCGSVNASGAGAGRQIYHCQMVGSQLKTKIPPTTVADVFAFG